MTWVLDLVRMLLSIFDRMVYGLIEVFYTAFIEISQVRVFTDDVLGTLADRVYTFLALIMLFKLSFSIISYVINPDNFSNSEKGMGKVIQNIVIMLVLLVATPHIFTQAYYLQRLIVTNNIVPQIILGTGAKDDLRDSEVHKSMSFTVLNAFLKPNVEQIAALTEDSQGYKCNGAPSGGEGAGKISSGFASCLNGLSEQTAKIPKKGFKTEGGTNQKVEVTIFDSVGMGEAYKYAYENNDYNRLIDLITAKYKEDKDIYLFDYTYLISTLAGGFVAWILLIFCFDIAVRSVKFSFLQLIAPIAIVSYVDPKSAKGGMFQKWTKTCLSTYADLFIRLIAIYFAVFIVQVVSDSSQIYYMDSSMGNPNFFIKVFIIIGALMFAKEIPKIISDITGINLSGKFELNPLKKLGQSPFAAAAIGGIGAMAGGAAANIYNGIKEGRGFGGTLRSALGGAASGLFRGAHAGLSGKGNDNVLKAAGAGLKGTVDARNLRARRYAAGDGGISGALRRTGVALQNAAGVESGASKFDKQVAAYDEFLKEQANLDSYLEGELAKGKGGRSVSGTWTDASGATHNFSGINLNQQKNMIEHLKNSGASAEDITNAEYLYQAALKQAKQDYIDTKLNATNPDDRDGAIDSMLSNMNYIIQQNENLDGFSGMEQITDGAGWDSSKGTIRGAKSRVTSSTAYRQAQINRRNDSNK